MSFTVHVAVAVIVNRSRQVCISLRHKDAHQGGLWEFPGGKVETGEDVDTALSREIKEELGLTIESTRPLITIPHDYGDKSVYLHVRVVTAFTGEAKGLEGQEVKWVPLDDLHTYDFPEANAPIINALQLPECYLITGYFDDAAQFLNKLSRALSNDIKLVQLRLKDEVELSTDDLTEMVSGAVTLCQNNNAALLLNLSQEKLSSLNLAQLSFDGIHLDSRALMQLQQRPEYRLVSASCHNKKELEQAQRLKLDFVVLSPVNKTQSHPEAVPMGWAQFEALVADVAIPVYALGGVGGNDIAHAQQVGAQGIAAISSLWKC